MRTLQDWFAAYQVSHQHPTNKAIHYVCVPAIVWSILGLLYGVHGATLPILCNGATLAAGLVSLYYLVLSRRLGALMVMLFALSVGACYELEHLLPMPLWQPCLAVFVLAWIGQFWGHKIEGRKPSFVQDLQFLLIGPLWVLAHLSGDDRA